MECGRFSLMTFSFEADIALKKMTVEKCMTLAKNAGLPYVDVMNLTNARVQEYLTASRKTGVKPYCYIGTLSFFSMGEEKIRETLKAQIHTAQALGAKLYMIVPMDVARDEKVCEKLGKAKVRSRLKTYFTLAVSLAEGTGVQVCFETTPREYTCLSGIEDCQWILERVPGLGLVFDTANMLPHGDDPQEYYEALKSHIVHTHVKDVALIKPTWRNTLFFAERTKSGDVMRCCMSGEGVIPLKEILRRMEKDGYTGIYALEYSHPEKHPADFEAHTRQMEKHMKFFE